ncbi:unnamed protein product [Mytilus coruscus]|uniref:Reverse transcriptase/retrotransposon-derived protein RNase H-like domain-containing protein n=1 Tax=Mytilus coruscus TaxID=42192 RepID=A0A6J8EIP2_MYTCO|nr:unnamed protein product [Mytilus coruscus]
MWTAGLDWDDQLDKYREWFRELNELFCIKIPRCLQVDNDIISTSFHTFSDASQEAYGSVIHDSHVYKSGTISTKLIAAKSRVAPLISVSIPRLELMTAVLVLKLARSVKHVLEVPEDNMTFWSREYKPFVANRIGEIHTPSHPKQWRHMPTKVNSADLVSRGREEIGEHECYTCRKRKVKVAEQVMAQLLEIRFQNTVTCVCSCSS